MIDPKAVKQVKPQTQAAPKGVSTKSASPPDATRLQDRIRSRAHELYLSRGRGPGHEQQDWLQAEQETLNPRR